MEYFPATLTRIESDALVDRIEAIFAEHDWGPWAAELRATGELIGFIGLSVPAFEAHFTPCVEIGWRLAAAHWGKGLATEGACAALDYGFNEHLLPEVVSFTTAANLRSRRVMEKLTMTHDPADDFDHPGLVEGHPLRRHVLYRLRNPGEKSWRLIAEGRWLEAQTSRLLSSPHVAENALPVRSASEIA
jgi:RimJ/RimL family protein N-acetyltransferase